MGLDDHPKLTEDLVLHIWEAITVIGNARGRSEEFGESGVEVVLVQAEAILLAIVSEVARCVGRSTRQPRKVRESGSWQTVLSKLVVGLMSNPSDALLPGKRRCGGDGRTDAYPEQIVKVRIRRHLCLDHDIEFLVLG